MQIDFLGMQAFLAIVERGSFLQAAQSLNLSQTAVSHRMRKFEESLGTKLITRTSREITLTDAGRSLLPTVRQAMRELDASLRRLRGQGVADRQWIAMACLPTVAAWQLASPLQGFRQQWPGIAVRVFDSTIQEIVELVTTEAAAFGIGVDTPDQARDLNLASIGDEPFVAVCHKTHALAARKSISWADLGTDPLIRISLPAGNSATIDDALGPVRDALHWAFEVQHTALALNWVRAAMGLTVVPRMSVLEDGQLHVLELTQPRVTRNLIVMTRANAELAPVAQQLLDAVVAHIRTAIARP